MKYLEFKIITPIANQACNQIENQMIILIEDYFWTKVQFQIWDQIWNKVGRQIFETDQLK